jgi:hypothetical protein
LERLGSCELYVRIGGVHALEHVMHDSPEHYNDVIEVLTAFIRDRAPRRGRQVWHPVTGSVPDPDLPPEPTPDIQAALTALGHRPHRPQRQPIDLAGLHLANAELGGADLTGVILGGADLTGANLYGADLSRANLHGVDLTGAQLTTTDLTAAGLDGANLNDALFVLANFTGAYLTNTDLTDAWLAGANFTGAHVHRANFTGAHLGGADFTDAHLTNSDLTRAAIDDANLTAAMLTAAAGPTGALLAGVVWPPEVAVPAGWERDAGGRLKQSSTSRDGQGN